MTSATGDNLLPESVTTTSLESRAVPSGGRAKPTLPWWPLLTSSRASTQAPQLSTDARKASYSLYKGYIKFSVTCHAHPYLKVIIIRLETSQIVSIYDS